MEQIGYSLIDSTGNELVFWGDVAGQTMGMPDFVKWPNGDQTYCPSIGMENDGCKIVQRMLVQSNGTQESQTISYDGTQIIITRTIVPARALVSKSVIVDRLQNAGKLDAARAALNASDLYTQERWNVRTDIYADDPTALALLQAIGADPAVILAPN